MFQAELRPARLLKQLIEALKEVVQEVKFECSETQMVVQAMDSSHVSLVALELNADKFQSYRCEKSCTLGVNCGNLAKMLKCAGNDDTVKLMAQEDGDTLTIHLADEAEDRVSDFSMKLMEIDAEALGIPDQDYQASVTMPSSEFARICKDIANFGDTITVDIKKDGVAFSAQGDIGTGRMLLKATKEIDTLPIAKKEKVEEGAKKEKEEGATKEEAPTKEEPEVKKEPATPSSEKTTTPKEGEDTKTTPQKDGEEPKEEGKEDGEPSAKRRRTTAEKEAKDAEKAAEKEKKELEKKEKKEQKERDQEEEERRKKLLQAVRIECEDQVQLQFALRYLTMFSKAQSVSEVVTMKLAKDTPMIMEFAIEAPAKKDAPAGTAEDERLGMLRYYLAPKVGEGDDEAPAAADE